MKTLYALIAAAAIISAQMPSDDSIRAAIQHGKSIPAKKLWDELKKKQQYRINRAGLDPIEKKVMVLSDLDRIALEAAEATRQLREISVEEIKQNIPMGVIDVLIEANCYNSTYSGSLAKWGPDGGLHVVLKVGDKVIQPIQKRSGKNDSVSVLPSETGVVSRQGNMVTYTPLYQTAIYERASQRAWFTFPAVDDKTFIVVAISGEGKQKEKEVQNPR